MPDALPVVDPQRVEELEDLSEVDRANDEIVIPTPEIVIHVHAIEQPMIDEQLRRVSR